jgi:hypothetical protein
MSASYGYRCLRRIDSRTIRLVFKKIPFEVGAHMRIVASPATVYGIIADYENTHAKILPKQFSNLQVEKGGVGAGTVITYRMKFLGRNTFYRAIVTEPQPGRVLVERNVLGGDAVTTFTVDPGPTGQTDVTISTSVQIYGGPVGDFQKFLINTFLKPLYVKELLRLSSVASRRSSGSSSRSGGSSSRSSRSSR